MVKSSISKIFYLFERDIRRAMGVSNVNTSNNIIKLALAKKTAKTSQVYKPEYLRMTGSIFNAPGLPTTPETLRQMNTRRSLSLLNPKTPSDKTVTGGSTDKGSPFEAHDVGSAKAALANAGQIKGQVQNLTKTTKSHSGIVNKFAANADRLQGSIVNGDKKFSAELKTQQTQLDRDNKRLAALARETEQTQLEVEKAQHELERLNSGSSPDKTKSGELQQLIGAKVGKLQQNGKMIYSLQRSQTRTFSRMNRTNRNYVRMQRMNSRNIQSQQKETNKVLDFANKVEEYSAYAQMGGQALEVTGQALVALGSSTTWCFGAGAALVSIGTVMMKVGVVVSTIGQYGQAAAGITKTAAYAADGNLMGAMMSCASAIQSGAAAVRSTTTMKSTFENINNQAKAATENLAAKSAAKDIVNEQTKGMSKAEAKEALGGMSKKQARKYVTADLREQMHNNYVTSDGKWANTRLKDLKRKVNEGFTRTIKDSDGKLHKFENWTAEDSLKAGMNKYNRTKEDVAIEKNIVSQKTNKDGNVARDVNAWENKYEINGDLSKAKITGKNKYITIDGKEVKISRYKKEVNKRFEKYTQSLTENVPRSSAGFAEQLASSGGNITSIAAMFMQNRAMEQAIKRQPEPWQMDARTQRIRQRNQMYRRHISYGSYV